MKPYPLLKALLVIALFGTTRLAALSVAEITDVSPKSDEAPVPVRTTAPEYPAELRQAEIQGLVTIVSVVDETGNVLACEISKSTNEGFNEVALAAVRKWKFKPAKLGGKAVKVKVTIPVRFTV
jgi:protein TonB